MKWFNKLSIGSKFLVIIMIFSAILLLITNTFSVRQFSSYNFTKAETESKSAMRIFQYEVNNRKANAYNFAKLIAANKEVIELVKQKDRSGIINTVGKLSSGANLDFVTITDELGNVIARTHEPSKFGDNISNQNNIKSALDNKQISVVETGTVVKLSARSGAPIVADGRVVGAVSTGFALDKPELLDELKQQLNCELTLFLGDVRVNTTVKDKEGKRLIGTKLSEKVANIVLGRNEDYLGEADLVGEPYVTSYAPLIGPDNKTIGVMFAGIPMKELVSTRRNLVFLLLPISIVIILVMSFIVFRIIRKIIIKPIEDIDGLANKLAIGDVNVSIDSKRTDEIGRLEHSLSLMVQNIKTQVHAAESIANGDLDVDISVRSEKDVLNSSLIKVINTLRGLIKDISYLTEAAVDGKLSTRAEAENYKGSYKDIVNGLNQILDGVITPINASLVVLDELSNGNLTVKFDGQYKGDFEKLQKYINNLTESLHKLIGDVSEAVAATASASTQISSSAEEMAAGAQEQSSQVTEVASAVEEMTRTIIDTTQNTSLASEAAKKSGIIAKDGDIIVTETVSGMDKITDVVNKAAETVEELGRSSDQIGIIVQVIDEIADQTNLLALNAAIEAARAGEQGRGFAVVADEVRKLAERTTKATKEIAGMIKTIQSNTKEAVQSIEAGTKEVEKGKESSHKAGKSLKEIIKGTGEVTDIVTRVAAASEEQSATAEQISKNIEGINSVSQETASGIQQIAKAAEDLNRLTENLQVLINRFKIHKNEHQFSYR